MNIEGPIFAIVTPFEENGKICYSVFSDYLDFLAEKGVKDIIVNGTTGEFASLTFEERRMTLEFCRNHFKGKIINHISACAVQDSRELLDHAKAYADAILVLPPFYYANVSSSGVADFFEAILEPCDLPVFLYNFPKHSQINIQPSLLKELSGKFECIKGIKDSSEDIENSKQLKRANPNLQVFVGADKAALEVLSSGLDGFVTGGGNPVPECLVGIHDSFKQGDRREAEKFQHIFDIWTDFRRSIQTSEISIAKAGLHARIKGFPVQTRPPLLSEANKVVEQTSDKLHKDILSLLRDKG